MATARSEALVTPTEDGGAIVDFAAARGKDKPAQKAGHGDNLALTLDDSVVSDLAGRLIEAVKDDIRSREQWEQTAERGLEALGLEVKAGPGDRREDVVESVHSTLLLEALTSFQAKALAITLPPTGPAKAELPKGMPDGPETEQARERAEEFVNWLLTRGVRHYQAEHDQLLFDTGLLGCGVKKVYACPTEPFGIAIERVPPEDLIVAYGARGLDRGRVTHRTSMPDDDLQRQVAADVYIDPETEGDVAQALSSVEEKRDQLQGQESTVETAGDHEIYEVHCDETIKGDERDDGLPRPYVVTIHVASQKVLSLRRNWREDDPDERRFVSFISYQFLPAKSLVYGYGLAHTLGNLAVVDHETMRQALLASLYANHPSGFKNANLGIRHADEPLKPGEFRDVDSPTGNIRDAFTELPFRGVDPGLIELRKEIVESGQRVAGAIPVNLAEMVNANTPVGTTLAALDETAAIRTSIHRRLWSGMVAELELLREVLLDAMAPGKPITFDRTRVVTREDIDLVRLEPAMPPGAPTRAHRVAEAQARLQIATQFPQLHDLRKVVESFYEALGLGDGAEMMTPPPPEAQPADPVSEAMAALQGKPVRAGPTQDHDSHIIAHGASIQIFQAQPALGAVAQTASAILQANIAEHMAMKLAVEVARRVGIPVEALLNGIPPEIEMQIAPAVAEAMQQVLAAMPKPPGPPDPLAVERMRSETKLAEAKLDAEVDMAKDAAETERNTADNQTALAIAALRQAQPSVRPSAPTQDQNPQGSPRR